MGRGTFLLGCNTEGAPAWGMLLRHAHLEQQNSVSWLFPHSVPGPARVANSVNFINCFISIPRDCSHFRKPWERKSFIRDNFIHLLNLIWYAVNRPLPTSGLEWLPRVQARGSRQPDPCCELLSCVRTEITCSAFWGLYHAWPIRDIQ